MTMPKSDAFSHMDYHGIKGVNRPIEIADGAYDRIVRDNPLPLGNEIVRKELVDSLEKNKTYEIGEKQI